MDLFERINWQMDQLIYGALFALSLEFRMIGLCTRFALEIIMGLGYRFIWDVWCRKYSEKRKHCIGHPRVVLNLLFGTMNSFKPFY